MSKFLFCFLCGAMFVCVNASAGMTEGNEAYKNKNYAKAFQEWRSVAVEGDAVAQFNIGWLYLNGVGVEKNYEKSMVWLRASAGQENFAARYALGLIYAKGLGVSQDNILAISLFRLAVLKGHKNAKIEFDNLARVMSNDELDVAEGLVDYMDDGGRNNDFLCVIDWFLKERKNKYSRGFVFGNARPTYCKSISPDGQEVIMREGMFALVWKRCAVGTRWDGERCIGEPLLFSRKSAIEYAESERARTNKEWRVPSINELRGLLVKDSPGAVSVNSVLFPDIQPGVLVSISYAPGPGSNTPYYWVFDYRKGSLTRELWYKDDLEKYALRLVRSARN